jgi:uncharacterized protein YjiK
MKASELIEALRAFDDEEVVVFVGFNTYEIGKNISYERKQRLIVIELTSDDVNNELEYR